MQAEDGYALVLHVFGELPGEEDVAEFRVVVRHHAPVVAGEFRREGGLGYVLQC